MGKRIFDLVISSTALTLLMPFIAVLAAIIKLMGKGGAFFQQERIGLNGKPFKIIKLRTMIEHSGGFAHLTTRKDIRITHFGMFLRKHKFDELPQLINVLRGEMSIVGPRPELRRYVEMFPKDYKIVLSVKPGITDYAALRFKNESDLLKSPETYEKDYIGKILPAKIGIYKEYVENQSLKTDLHILVSTLISLFGK
jgi:lipopolysaccharide/colanic/teichoic acid biosynthesis glycosyltransferase